ncbi:nitroreductase family protein [Rhodococcoides fascians]|uniref:nitroreductase family protein n=1 Tax=Rhodococcoides fascians TaxID=1828 RepID=UPI0018B01E60|nr:nitroreductase family protein [Rhodococcus fascians]
MKKKLIARWSVTLPKVIGAPAAFVISRAFVGEQRAVQAGKRMHFDTEMSGNNRMFLRRSIHRLEKGLVSKPRRDSFAGDFIQRTVNTAALYLQEQGGRDELELRWFKDVLDMYFRETSNSKDTRVIAARQRWSSLTETLPLSSTRVEKSHPFVHSALSNAEEKYRALTEIAHHRRSIRQFETKPVPRSLIEQAAEIGLTAPSACNRQSLRVIAVDDPALRVAISEVPMGTAGFAEQIPTICVVVGQLRGYEHERDRHAIYVDGGLFVTGFILGLEGLGLNSCCINWPDLDQKEAAMKKLVSLDDDERIIMLVAVGYGLPNQLVPRSRKRSTGMVVGWQ